MRRISRRSVIQRSLLCALVLLLTLAPISGAAAATSDTAADATATEAPAAAAEVATTAPEPTADASLADSQAPAETAAAQLQAAATEEVTTQQANQPGPYTPDPSASPTPSGNGNGNNPHDAGSKGNADAKNPPGQLPGPDTDGNVGYECDGNSGVAKGNPAHTQCPPPAPRITIVKAHTLSPLVDGQTIPVNGTATWGIRVTNTGNVTLTNVTVTDPLATGCERNLGTLAPGASAPAYTCTKAGVLEGFTNRADVVGTHPNGTVTAFDTAPVTVTTPNAPGITIVKAHTLSPLVDGQTIAVNGTATWGIRVTNTGNVTLTNVTVTDPLAPDCDENLGTLAPGASAPAYTCARAGVPSSFTNVANVVGTHPGGTVNASDTAPVTVTSNAPAISIVKAYTLNPLVDEQTIPVNGTASWGIRVTNTGNTPLHNVTVNDPLASGCNRSLGTLAAGASTEYTCSQGAVPASFTNRADVVGTSPQNVSVSAFDTAPVFVFSTPGQDPPGIHLIKTAPTPDCPRPGQSVRYRFEIRNTGALPLSNIALNDQLLGGAVTLPQTTLTPGQSMQVTRSYTLTAANIAAGTLNNTATVTSTATSTAGTQAVNNTANAVMILEDCPGEIRIDKRGPDTARVGEQITYTFTVTNTGSVTLNDVRITDQRLGISGLLVNPSTLAPGQQATATATYVVTEADARARRILNTAVVVGRTPDNTEVRDEDDHRTRVPRPLPGPEPRIRLDKSGPARANVGERITYTFTVTNTGNVTLTNVNVTDPLLGLQRLTVRPSTLAPDEQGTATATYVVTEADAEARSIYNTAVARGTAPDNRTVRDRDDHTVTVPLVPPGPPPPDLPATGLGTTGFALTALLSLALGGVLLGIAGSGNLQAAMANATVNADSPLLALLRQWNLAPKPGGAQARRRRRR